MRIILAENVTLFSYSRCGRVVADLRSAQKSPKFVSEDYLFIALWLFVRGQRFSSEPLCFYIQIFTEKACINIQIYIECIGTERTQVT